MATIVDARGKACPQPVIDTKNAIREHGVPVITLVDNDIARQNVEKVAAQMGYYAQAEALSDGSFRILIQGVSTEVLDGVLGNAESALESLIDQLPACPIPPAPQAAAGPTVVALSSACMGVGDDTLGAALMQGFVYALTQLDAAPDVVLLYNGGAKLSVAGAPTLADLQVLAEHGAEILTCGTCLNHYGLTDQLAVGSVTNMYAIAETLATAGRVIRP